MTNYFYHHIDQIFSSINADFCKPVVNSFVLLIHDYHYWCTKATGIEAPTIDPGNYICCKESLKACFEVKNVDALEVKDDNNDDSSDKDSKGDYKEMMPKKKNQKFVAEKEFKIELDMEIQWRE